MWQAAADLAAQMYTLTAQQCFRGKGDLANQLQRATLSISNNIAEGFERGSTPELLTFLYYARGSAGEVRSMLCVTGRMDELQHIQPTIAPLKKTCESISRQLRGWAAALQDSDIQGQRHLNTASRQRYDERHRRERRLQEHRETMQRREFELRAQHAVRSAASQTSKSEADAQDSLSVNHGQNQEVKHDDLNKP